MDCLPPLRVKIESVWQAYGLLGAERMNGNPLRQAADLADTIAISDDKRAGLVLIARFAERYCLGTAMQDEPEALARILR